jgi:hypothetical protein
MAGSPLFMQDVKLTLKLLPAGPSRVSFECDISLAEIIPTPGDSVDYSTLCASGSYSSIGKTTYALHIVAVQRWAADGLASFLWDNDGQLAEFQYQAHGAAVANATDTPGMYGTVRLVAGNYGGEVSTYAELDVTLPCTVKPTKTLAVFPTLAEDGAEDTTPANLTDDELAALTEGEAATAAA